jgi:hypothetical protein
MTALYKSSSELLAAPYVQKRIVWGGGGGGAIGDIHKYPETSPVAKFIVPEWGDKDHKVDSSIGSSYSYRPARPRRLVVGLYDNPAGVNYIPLSGIMNLVTGLPHHRGGNQQQPASTFCLPMGHLKPT